MQIETLKEIMSKIVEVQNTNRFGGEFPNIQTVKSDRINTASIEIGRYIQANGSVYTLSLDLRTGKLQSSDLFQKVNDVEEFELFDDWTNRIEQKYDEIQTITITKKISMNYFIEEAQDYLSYLRNEDNEKELELEEID